jgi:hypothetical protein
MIKGIVMIKQSKKKDSEKQELSKGVIKIIKILRHMEREMATKEDLERLERRIDDYRIQTDSRLAAQDMWIKTGGSVFTTAPRIPSGHAMIESRKDYRREKSGGR